MFDRKIVTGIVSITFALMLSGCVLSSTSTNSGEASPSQSGDRNAAAVCPEQQGSQKDSIEIINKLKVPLTITSALGLERCEGWSGRSTPVKYNGTTIQPGAKLTMHIERFSTASWSTEFDPPTGPTMGMVQLGYFKQTRCNSEIICDEELRIQLDNNTWAGSGEITLNGGKASLHSRTLTIEPKV